MTMPNFLVIGAGKGGTTSLHDYLGQHPQVYMSPIKETNYFTFEACQIDPQRWRRYEGLVLFPIQSLGAYRSLFRGVTQETAIGEASPGYLIWPGVAERIHHHLPHARLIAILRHPVERAFSSYLMHVRDRNETRAFHQAIREETAGLANPCLNVGQRYYIQLGFYHRHLVRYLRRFDRDQLAIYLHDDLRRDAGGLLRSLFRFLEVDESFVPATGHRRNVSGHPRYGFMGPLLRKSRLTTALRKSLPASLRERALLVQEAWRSRWLVRPELDPELRRELTLIFRDDILRLQDLIGRDLSHWLE